MSLKKTVVGAGMSAALALALGGAAQAATVYTLTSQTGCTTCGAGPFGTVTVTPTGNTLGVSISLNSGVYFNQAGSAFKAVAFSLAGDPAATITNMSNSNFSIAGLAENVENHYHQDGTGYYDYAINWIGAGNNSSLGVQSLSFDVNGTAPLALDFQDIGGVHDYFSIDIANTNVPAPTGGPSTGVVGGTISPAPEPSTWAMLIAGGGVIGFAMWRRRKRQLACA